MTGNVGFSTAFIGDTTDGDISDFAAFPAVMTNIPNVNGSAFSSDVLRLPSSISEPPYR